MINPCTVKPYMAVILIVGIFVMDIINLIDYAPV